MIASETFPRMNELVIWPNWFGKDWYGFNKVAFLSLLAILPGYLAWYGLEHLRARPPGPMAIQALVQGLGQGVLAMIAYSQAIRVLGVSRAVSRRIARNGGTSFAAGSGSPVSIDSSIML